MRISGGRARGIQLQVPKGDAVRPATDGLRQALFSSLAQRVSNAQFLDLFAGSGAYGLEALSRGAAGGVWVERHSRTAAYLERNVAAVCRSLGRDTVGLTVINGDATTVPWTRPGAPDLVFIDPPYERIPEVAPVLFERLGTLVRASPHTLVVFELPGEMQLSPPGWTLLRRLGKGTGQPTLAMFSPVTGPPPPA